MKLANRRMYYSKEIKFDNVKEKLSEEVSRETCQDIEDFLLPKFDTHLPRGRRKWRIVQDGHGRWREINIDGQDKIPGKCDITDRSLPKRTSVIPASNKLLFSNNVLNSVRSASELQSGRSPRQDSNYKALSTNTRANVFQVLVNITGLANQTMFTQRVHSGWGIGVVVNFKIGFMGSPGML